MSVTSRPIRPGEIEGRDYHFISEERFKERIDSGDFIEHARVHGNYYGTSRTQVLELIARGYDVILDIDVQGMLQLERTWPYDLVTVFILPPSFRELRHRLVSRGTDQEDDIRRRLQNAAGELEYAGRYRYLLVNREIDEAVSGFRHVVAAERSKANRNDRLLAQIVDDFHAVRQMRE